MRTANIERKTAETDIQLTLNLDGSGKSTINTGIGFMDHMLTLFAAHGKFDLTVTCKGDVQVDDHHSAEDIGICLGKAFEEALGEKRGINRYGSFILPMDEALILSAADLSGRTCLCFNSDCLGAELVGKLLCGFELLGFVKICRCLCRELYQVRLRLQQPLHNKHYHLYR